jgi:bifunctional non-homologous end joining protein LigD
MLARYLPPATPTLRSAPPSGERWLHEVKFDGWRIQLHKDGRSAAAFTKNGHDHSNRVRWMTDALARLPGARSLIIDGELVACDHNGLSDSTRCTSTLANTAAQHERERSNGKSASSPISNVNI